MKKLKNRRASESAEDLLKKLLIVQLCIGGVPQGSIAKIVGKSLSDVNAIAKHIKISKK